MYMTGVGETPKAIYAEFYVKDKNGNLTFKAKVTDPNFANNQFKTSEWTANQGTTYTIIINFDYLDNANNLKTAQNITSITP